MGKHRGGNRYGAIYTSYLRRDIQVNVDNHYCDQYFSDLDATFLVRKGFFIGEDGIPVVFDLGYTMEMTPYHNDL